MKKNLQTGLDALIASTQTNATDGKQQAATANGNRKPKSVCYSIDEDLASRMRFIASYERRNISDVVEDAFYRYIKQWQPEPVEVPSVDDIKAVKHRPERNR